MVYDEEKDISEAVAEIDKILKENINTDLNIEKMVMDQASEDNIDLNVRDAQHLIKDIKDIINSLGEKKWKDEKNRSTLKKHCDDLGLDCDTVYDNLMNSFYDKYFKTDPIIIKRLREKLQILSSLVQGKRLRDILAKSFRIKKEIEYDKVKYILSNILDDEYIYSIDKIDSSCEHVVPRKVFNAKQPYNSDIHNLYLAIDQINMLRDTKKFNNTDVSKSKKYYGNRYTETEFEPLERSKGVVARACAYFFTMYPEHFGAIIEVIDIKCLKDWGVFKPNISEHERNLFIYQLQNNINPYIIYPKLVQHAFCDVDENFLIVSSIERRFDKNCNIIEKAINDIDSMFTVYNDNVDNSYKATFGMLRLDKLKESFNRFKNFWM